MSLADPRPIATIARRILFVLGVAFLLTTVLLGAFLVYWPAPINDELDFKLRVVVWTSLLFGAPLIYFFSKKPDSKKQDENTEGA